MEYKDSDGKPIYFAQLEPDQFAACLSEKIDQEYNRRTSSGRYDLLRRSYFAYFGLDEQGNQHAASSILPAGDKAELSSVKVNQYRNLVQHVLVLGTSDKPNFEVQATNNSADSLREVRLSKGLLDYYLYHKNFIQQLYDAAEMSLYQAEAYVKIEWDPEAGEPAGVDPDSGEPLMSGDVTIKSYTTLDVLRKPSKQPDIDQWVMLRDWVNRWDLIAKYPNLREEILKAHCKKDILANELGVGVGWLQEEEDEDEIALYTFYHSKTPALPEGRKFSFLSADVWLSDDVLLEGIPPISRISPANMHGTSHGYTNFFDVLGPQKVLDAIDSTIVSNQNAFGVQMIWAPNGGVTDVKDLGRGLALLQGAPGAEPKPLQLTKTPTEVFSYRNEQRENMELLAGVSSVTRGQPEANLRTGPALALVQAMSVKFNSGFQRSWANLLVSCGTNLLLTLQRHAQIERMVLITGESNEPYLEKFSGDSIKSIRRVNINVGSALLNGTAGRMEVATQLLQAKIPGFEPRQYFNVLETGRLDAATESPQLTNILLAQENEALIRGEKVTALPIDHHLEHFLAHLDPLKHPEVRNNPTKAQNAMEHLQDHLDFWQDLSEKNPAMLQALGIPPIPPSLPPEMGGAPPGQEQAEAPSAMKDVNKVMAATATQGQASRLPSMPTNPLTGEKPPLENLQGKVV